MRYLTNEIKGSTNSFRQSLGKDRHIKVTTMYDDYWLELYGDDDNHILMRSISEYDFSIAQFVEEMSFKGHYVYIKALCVEDWGHKRFHRQRKVYFKDRRIVDFLRDNIIEIFRQGGDEYHVTRKKNGYSFKFRSRDISHINVYGVIDPVNGNFLTDSKREAEGWMKPGCRWVETRIYYENKLKDVKPVFTHDGFNYYDAVCDSAYLEDRLWFGRYDLMATFGDLEPRDSVGPKTKFLLKMREGRPDLFYPCFYIPDNDDEQIRWFKKDGDMWLYFIATGESCRLDDHRERHFREHCRTAIEEMVKALDGTDESSVCQSLDDRFTVFGEIHHELRMDRPTGEAGSKSYILRIGDSEYVISEQDAVDGFKVASEWLYDRIGRLRLAEKWNALATKWNGR